MVKLCVTLIAALLVNALIACNDSNSSELRTLHVPADFQAALALDGFIDIALVKDESLTLQDMLAPIAVFSPLAGHDINLGFVQTSVWMRFTLARSPDSKQPQNVLLSLAPNFTDELDVYVGLREEDTRAEHFDRYEMGDHSPHSQGHLDTSSNILPLTLKPGETTAIYIRARNHDASLNLSVALMSPATYEYNSIIQNIVRGSWFGGMGVLLVIQIFFLYFDRKKIYLFLAIDILAVGSTYFGSLGLARLLFFGEGGFGNDYFTSSSSWLGLTAGSLSISEVLQLRQRYPRLALFCRLAALIGLVGVLCVFAGVNRYFVIVAGPVILSLTTLAMVVAFLDLSRTRDAQQGLNFMAFSLLWGGLLVTNSQRYGLLPLPTWIAASYAVSAILHFTFLTGSLAVRLRKAEISIIEADRRALRAANAEIALNAELRIQEQQVRFMEVISHQYRTPLGVIRTNLESIRLTLPKHDDANHNRLSRANIGIRRLVEVLEVNLSRSKIQGPSYQPNFVNLRIADLAKVVVANASDLLPDATIDFDLSTDAEGASVLGDPEMLQLALLNLLENAFKFSLPVGSTQIGLSVFCAGREIFLKVTDKGIGISAGEIGRLVEHSVRGSNTSHIEGAGIGLSLVKRTVEAHGGRLSLGNRPEGGTEATIVLIKDDEGFMNRQARPDGAQEA